MLNKINQTKSKKKILSKLNIVNDELNNPNDMKTRCEFNTIENKRKGFYL